MQYENEALPLHKKYAKRHKLELLEVLNNEMFETAAYLEFQIETQLLAVSEARRAFVASYPHTNVVVPSFYRRDRAGRTFKHKCYSVIDLVRPPKRDAAIYRIKNLNEIN